MQNVIVYTMENCPNCRATKELLTRNHIDFGEKIMEDPDVMTELNIHKMFPLSAPLILYDGKYLTFDELKETLKC